MNYYVYFVTFKKKGNQPVKIGYSATPDKRLASLQTACPYKLAMPIKLPFETEALAREAERTMQWLAGKKHKRMHGEWFLIYGGFKGFIAGAMKLFDNNQDVKKFATLS